MTSGSASAREIGDAIEAYLARQHAVSLATVDDQGNPHAASLLYALDGLALIWTSDPSSRHSQHLERKASVAATIAADCADFHGIRGVQMHGVASRLRVAADVDDARCRMRARYPFLEQLAQAPPTLLKLWRAWRDGAFYRLQPRRITMIDNTRGFGHKLSVLVGPDGGLDVVRADGRTDRGG